jgi:hypothetical protein
MNTDGNPSGSLCGNTIDNTLLTTVFILFIDVIKVIQSKAFRPLFLSILHPYHSIPVVSVDEHLLTLHLVINRHVFFIVHTMSIVSVPGEHQHIFLRLLAWFGYQVSGLYIFGACFYLDS